MSEYRKGIVHWFDVNAGEGAIIDKEDGVSYYVHYSAIDTKDKFKKLDKGQLVDFLLYENLYMKQVDVVKPIKKKRTRNKAEVRA
jgi:cold shock CspA family protein